MSKLTTMLQERFLKKEKPKVTELAEKSAQGQLSSFSAIFGMGNLDEKDKEKLTDILKKYPPQQDTDVATDLIALIAISSEVKAINNQAAILHGERIKKAQDILKKYRDGAFTAWLLATYGNRQTPYNFLQYYDFYTTMPKTLHAKIETMPRQAVYTLASRDGPLSKKEEVVKNYQGETKDELLTRIRALFPLNEKDKRRENVGNGAHVTLERLCLSFTGSNVKISASQKKGLLRLISEFASLVDACECDE